jgi:hypothetical protein
MALSPTPRSASPAPSVSEAKPSARNPISVRLYRVLGSNFDDDATKAALETISALYVTHKPRAKEIESLRAHRDDGIHDESGEAAVKPSSTSGPLMEENVPGESAARARKNLRRDMENKLTNASKQFLDAFREVDQVCVLSTRSPFVMLYSHAWARR